MAGALEGVKVLDLSRVLAGPLCTMMLADLGADVVKVERPGSGDETREWGPPWAGTESAYYLCVNRNKRSLTLDLKAEAGKAVIRRLAREADVVVENFKTGTLEAMGLGYEVLSADNPGLILCSITGYGHTGPDKDQPGYDFAIQGRGGIMSITGEPDGPPMKVGLAIVDVTAAQHAAIAVLAALRARERTGRGQCIDIALLDSQVSWLINRASNYLIGGAVPKRYGNAHPNIVPYETFRASDTWFNLAVGNDSQFRRFTRLIGAPELADDPRFVTNPARVEHRAELVSLLGTYLRRRTAAEWLELFRREKIPCGPINSIPEVFADPQVLAREMVVEMTHPTAGTVKLVGSPLKLSDTPVTFARHPPLLGEHTDEILAEAGYSREEIRELRERGVV
ncbi:MAG: CoA transferase [Actinobacteria bacterium]|nr:CoA transferase [Actinomycetota bacterium]